MKPYLYLLAFCSVMWIVPKVYGGPPIDEAKQGFSMRLWMDNRGVFGRQAFPGTIPTDSLGCEYPLGTNVEHIFGGGIWIGGLLDTSAAGNSTPLKLVTTGYQGWTLAGELFETFPKEGEADTIWETSLRDTVAPPGWDDYWKGVIPFSPVSDKDLHMKYDDFSTPISSHIPMNLEIYQSAFAWESAFADAIIIVEYKILNVGVRQIDSAYVGWFFEADVGPTNVTSYWVNNFAEYIPASFTAYIHNPVDQGSTPIGATALWPQDTTLQYTFRWYPGQQSPTPDAVRYDFIRTGITDPSEFPQTSDTRFLFGFGPFTIKPVSDPTADTLTIAIGIVSGFDRRIDHRIVLTQNANRAKDIYLNRGLVLPAEPPSPPLRMTVGFRRVSLDWKWRLGDDQIYGRGNPEANWDTTNNVARRYPSRYSAPHPIGHDPATDTTRGGRNFSAYRVWRSENPAAPDNSYTLLAQYDVAEDSFEYNTGLQYEFVDSNLVRGKTYVYSVTSVSIPSLAYQTVPTDTGNVVVEVPVDALESLKQVNSTTIELPFSVSSELGAVSVVPNPYRTDHDYSTESGGYEGLFRDWDETKRTIKLINLPEVCTIRIFSLSGDLIRTVEHDGRGESGIPRGDVNVPLLSESNRALASGIYIFTVDSDLGIQTGKFVIIR